MSDEESRRLREEIERLQGYAGDVIYRLRYRTMRYEYVSPNIERLIGFSAEELGAIGLRSLIEETRIVTDNLRKIDSFDSLEDNRKRGDVLKWQADYLMRTKDGRRIWVADVSYPWHDEKGSVIGSIGTLRDITERVEAEARQKDEISESRRTDPLTRFATRPAFFERLDEELRRVKRSRGDVALMLVAVDGFAELLTAKGRGFADRLIREFADIVRLCLRETDLPARIEDAEIAIALPDTPAEGAFWVGERIRDAVARHRFQGNDHETIATTVSIGVAGARFDDHHIATDLFKTAQSRLYIARHTGQNQVSFDELLSVH